MELRRLEQWMTYIRAFGVLFGGVSVAIQPHYPSRITESVAWGLVALLALGTAVIRKAIDRLPTESDPARLGALAYLFDSFIIMGFVWVFAFEDPYVTWALVFVLPMEGALRYRLTGALAAAGAVAAFFIPQTMRVADMHEGRFDISFYIFVVGLAILLAGVTGTMAENWYRQNLAFQRQTLALAEVDRLKDRFLAVTSHEIRGPLTAVIGGVDTVRRRGERMTDEQRDRMLEMVYVQSRQLARLVDDLLITSQIQNHTLALHPEWADLGKTIGEAVQGAESKRRDHQLEVFVDPLECEIDASRIGQILRNLVENAYKYTPDRTRIAVTAERAKNGIVIEVADEGEGIPHDKREQLFDAFSRIEATAAGREGVGLGLYVVSQLVAAMGGRIDLESSSRGTTFTLRIPCDVRSPEKPQLGLVDGRSKETGT